MKRSLALLLTAALLFSMSACGQTESVRPAAEIGAELRAAVEEPEQVEAFAGGSLETALLPYGIASENCADGWVLRSTGTSAFELVLLRLTEDADPDAVQQVLEQYRHHRQGTFTGYAPADAALVVQSRIVRQGRWIGLLVCPDAAEAAEAFEKVLGTELEVEATPVPTTDPGKGRIPYTDPEDANMVAYDTAAIRQAHRTGDESGLSVSDREILTACRALLDRILTDGMTEYEREYAVYYWVSSCRLYERDMGAEQYPDTAVLGEHLFGGEAICLNYAVTLQLLMELSDIPCLTVIGASYGSKIDHAWNLAYVNGNWYGLDVSWELLSAYGGNQYRTPETDLQKYPFDFFNLTSDELAATDHQWDYTSVPEAVAADRGLEAYE